MNTAEILTILLREVETNPQAQIEEILLTKVGEYGLSESDKQMLLDAFKVVDKISAEHQNLANIRENGGTRDSYVSQGITKISENKSDEQLKEFAQAVNEVTKSQLANTERGED